MKQIKAKNNRFKISFYPLIIGIIGGVCSLILMFTIPFLFDDDKIKIISYIIFAIAAIIFSVYGIGSIFLLQKKERKHIIASGQLAHLCKKTITIENISKGLEELGFVTEHFKDEGLVAVHSIDRKNLFHKMSVHKIYFILLTKMDSNSILEKIIESYQAKTENISYIYFYYNNFIHAAENTPQKLLYTCDKILYRTQIPIVYDRDKNVLYYADGIETIDWNKGSAMPFIIQTMHRIFDQYLL